MPSWNIFHSYLSRAVLSLTVMCQSPYYLLKDVFLGHDCQTLLLIIMLSVKQSNIITPHSPMCSFVSFFLFTFFSILKTYRYIKSLKCSVLLLAWSFPATQQVNLHQCELRTFSLIYWPIPHASIAPGRVRIQHLCECCEYQFTPASILYSRIFCEILGLNLDLHTSELCGYTCPSGFLFFFLVRFYGIKDDWNSKVTQISPILIFTLQHTFTHLDIHMHINETYGC